MKRYLFLSTLVVFTFSFANAQTDNKNVVKFFPTSLMFGKATIGYERVLNSNSSLTLNFGFPSGINPLDYVPELPSNDITLNSGKLSGLFIMPGYRFNFSKKGAPVGFFIEPYLKYESFNLDFNAEITDNNNELYPANFLGDYSGYGGGIQMGVQCLIANRITLEWSFLGLEAKMANANITITDLGGNVNIDELFNNISTDFSDIPIIGKSLVFEKGAHSVGAKASNFILPGARFAFSIGIAF